MSKKRVQLRYQVQGLHRNRVWDMAHEHRASLLLEQKDESVNRARALVWAQLGFCVWPQKGK